MDHNNFKEKRVNSVTLIDSSNFSDFHWPRSASAHLCKKLLGHYVFDGTKKYIKNTNLQVILAVIGEKVTPIVVNQGHSSGSYLSSPYTNYIVYASDFVSKLDSSIIRIFLSLFISLTKLMVKKSRLDKVVYVNNWLFGVCPKLELTLHEMEILAKVLLKKFPQYAIVFKGSRDEVIDGRKCFFKIFSRNIYLWDCKVNSASKKLTKNFTQDRKHLIKNIKLVSRDTDNSCENSKRFADLYEKIYINKYSNSNNQLTAEWFKKTFQSQVMQYFTTGIERDVDSFIGYFKYDDEILLSVLGHEPDLCKKHGLYRLGVNRCMLLAEDTSSVLNLCSGSGDFKQRRGCSKVSEYDIVNISDVGFFAKISWRIIGLIYNTMGKRIYDSFEI